MRAPSSFQSWNFRPLDNWTPDIWSSEHLNFWTLIFWTNELKRSVFKSSIVKSSVEVYEEFWSRLIAGIIAFLVEERNTIWYLSVPLKKWMLGLNNKLGKILNIWRYLFFKRQKCQIARKISQITVAWVASCVTVFFLLMYLKVRNTAE